MKLFDVDWGAVLKDMGRWALLPLPARRILLDELKTQGFVPAARFGQYLDLVVDSGIAAYEPDKRRVWLGDARRELVKVLRALGRHRIFHLAPVERDEMALRHELLRYMEEHFTGDEVQRIASAALKSRVYANRETLAPFVQFPAWVGELLDAEDDEALLAWAESHGRNASAFIANDIAVLLDLQALVRHLLAFPGGMPLRDLVAMPSGDMDLPALGDAMHVGLASLALFAGMRAEDLEPMVGLWPSVVRELTRAEPTKPESVEVGETFVLAVFMEDMTTLLAAAAATPVRVRANDAAVFARTRVDIERRLVALPPWVAQLVPDDRIDRASGGLRAHGLAILRELDGNPHLHATPAGMRWLALSARDRLVWLLEPMRMSKERNPRSSYEMDGTVGFFPYALPYYRAPKSVKLRHDLERALLQAADAFIPIDDFLEYEAHSDNPLSALAENPTDSREAFVFYSGYADPRSSARDVWRQMLATFLTTRLVGLGGATVGLHESGKICFSLTSAGRYLLGAADTIEYGEDDAADVVVQPNFDVVFLGAAPAVEAELARFSERVGVAPGRVFVITRASVLGAAESGATVGDVIGALARASSRPVPKNVQHEIAGWMGTVRRVRLRRAELLQCASEEDAARVVSLLGANVHRISPVLLELPDVTPAVRASMMKKLRAGGVFIDDANVAEGKPPARGRGGR